jgi:hypothetical protein
MKLCRKIIVKWNKIINPEKLKLYPKSSEKEEKLNNKSMM